MQPILGGRHSASSYSPILIALSAFLENILNQARAGRRLVRTWFLEMAFVWEVSMCVCVLCVCVVCVCCVCVCVRVCVDVCVCPPPEAMKN